MNRAKIREWSLILAWGMYDLANQFFVVNVVSLYFVRWLTLEKGAAEILYSFSFGVSTFLVAVCAPILGSLSDISGRRKPFLIYLTLLSVVFTVLLGAPKSIFFGLLFFVIANFGCQLAVVFYNALMVNVAPPGKIGLVSGLGRMLGYSGAILALFLLKPVVLRSGYQATFLPTGVLFFLFSLPCLVFVKDKEVSGKIFSKDKVFSVFNQLKDDLLSVYRSPRVPDFLKGAFCGLCVVNVIILFMSVYATRVFGLNETQIINLMLFATLFAILGSLVSGYASDRIGAVSSLIWIYILWGISLFLGAFSRSINLYWLVGALVGLALGATWVVLRALAIQLVPPQKSGAIFGLFNLIGCFSGVVGALFWGIILLFLSPLGEIGYRIALLSLNIFFLFGFIFLLRLLRNRSRSQG
ncbi:MAG: MFS transporter [Candidatus Omnitrophota bacterium]